MRRITQIKLATVASITIAITASVYLNIGPKAERPSQTQNPEVISLSETRTESGASLSQHPNRSASQSAVPTAVNNGATPLSMPDADLPLSAQFDTLLQLHRQGVGSASCRLIVGLRECSEAHRSYRYSKARIEQMLADANDQERAQIAALDRSVEAGFAARATSCPSRSRLPSADQIFSESMAYLTPRQRLLVVLSGSDGKLRLPANFGRSSEMASYTAPRYVSEYTMPFLQQGIEGRDMLALVALIGIHSPTGSLRPGGAGPLLPDPAQFYLYSAMYEELVGEENIDPQIKAVMQSVELALPRTLVEVLKSRAKQESTSWRTVGNPEIPFPRSVRETLDQCG